MSSTVVDCGKLAEVAAEIRRWLGELAAVAGNDPRVVRHLDAADSAVVIAAQTAGAEVEDVVV